MSLKDIGKDCEITLTEPNGKTSSWIANSVTVKSKEPTVRKVKKKKKFYKSPSNTKKPKK